jgi:hypothetical protein
MNSFWGFVNSEPELVKKSYAENRGLYDLAIHTWESGIFPTYFDKPSVDSICFVMYKTQSDAAIKRAISSVLLREYAQAIFNIRLAIENMQIALYAYEMPTESTIEYGKLNDKTDDRIKKIARKFLNEKLPDISEKFKSLNTFCNNFGSHQTISHHGRYVDISNEDFVKINYIGEYFEELEIGLAGITVGAAIEFDEALQKLGRKEWLPIMPESHEKFKQIKARFNRLQAENISLFIPAFSKS